MELDLRKKHSFNVVAIKIKEEVVTFIDPSMPLQKDMVLLVIADVSKIKKWNK